MNIWFSNPYSRTKNFGKAINDFCEIVPDDQDWIVIQDGDMMYLDPYYGTKIHAIIEANKDRFALFGCMTNRLGSPHQLHNGQISEDHNILNHIEIAKQYSGLKCLEVDGIAGVFMAFQKSTWKKAGRFIMNDFSFDTMFCNKVKELGLKIGLMQGLYVYHQYRPWSKSPKNYTLHLK